MRPLVSQTPPFLGDGLASFDETTSFACEEKESQGSLLVNGRSTWRTSKGICDLPRKVLPKQLLLAVSSRLSVELSEDSPLSDWPRVQGLSGCDDGNYLSVLYFAWAYILSARWVELLNRSADHECHMGYTTDRIEGRLPPSNNRPVVQIDIGDDTCQEEVLWCRPFCALTMAGMRPWSIMATSIYRHGRSRQRRQELLWPLSEGATRGIFEWLRSTGYPLSEQPIYQHSWVDLEDIDDEEELDDAESDVEKQLSPKKKHVDSWVDGIE